MIRFTSSFAAVVWACFALAPLGAQEAAETPPPPQPAEILPPQDLDRRVPALPQAEPIPPGRIERGVRPLRPLGPDGRGISVEIGGRGVEFGLDMANRGISFGLRFANRQATPADARAFGIDMGRRGRAFGLEMRDRAAGLGDGIEALRLPADGRDAEFKEVPGDITIEAPPLPGEGADAPRRPQAEPPAGGRETTRRSPRFRREF